MAHWDKSKKLNYFKFELKVHAIIEEIHDHSNVDIATSYRFRCLAGGT